MKLKHFKKIIISLKLITSLPGNYFASVIITREGRTFSYLNSFLKLPMLSNANVKKLKILRDKSNDIRTALINLDRPLGEWKDLFNYIIISKLDRGTMNAWELEPSSSDELPTFTQLEEFISSRISVSKAIESTFQKRDKDRVTNDKTYSLIKFLVIQRNVSYANLIIY